MEDWFLIFVPRAITSIPDNTEATTGVTPVTYPSFDDIGCVVVRRNVYGSAVARLTEFVGISARATNARHRFINGMIPFRFFFVGVIGNASKGVVEASIGAGQNVI